MNRFSIIIPTYNSVRTLVPLLESIFSQIGAEDEVIVVDDASNDDTREEANRFQIAYFRQDRRRGPAAARNRGAAEAKGKWLIFTDADTCYEPDTLHRISQAVQECDGDAFVGTYAGTPANGGFMPKYKALWELITIDETLLSHGGDYVPYNTWAPRPGIVSKEAFGAVSGFNERFTGADLEDMEFGYRLKASGYRIFFAPLIKIKHHYPATFWKEIRPFARRCRLWMGLKRPEGFDAAGEGSPQQAFTHLCGFGVFGLLMLGIIIPLFFLPAFLLGLVYFWGNRVFLYRAFRQYGWRFSVQAALVCWFHTVVMGFSAGLGLLQRIMGGR